MATLALGTLGSVVGGAIAGPLGATAGRVLGGLAGAYIDQSLFGGSGQTAQRKSSADTYKITASTEGQDIARLYGRARLGGNIIWATYLQKVKVNQSSGKGLSASSSSGNQQSYKYLANFAVALCQGEITKIGTVWADGNIIDLSKITYRLYTGTETQLPDGLIIAKEGPDNSPAYRGLAYIVFEALDLTSFGNRIPQLNFEVFRAVDDLERRIEAVTMIPAAGEFVYDTVEITRQIDVGRTASENRNSHFQGTDFVVSLDDLQQTLPNATAVSLFVTWFGNDLRCGNCQITPRVDNQDKDTTPTIWTVSGLDRSHYSRVSLVNGQPAFGGTPSDDSVVHAIQEMHRRGMAVAFTPFMLMDIPAGNTLPDPYTGGTGQAVYPWRGRITCSPAPGVAGTPDKTATAGAQVAAFVAQYRNFVLHYASLCAAAGGVEIFVIGSELRGLGWVRSSASAYPFVTALKTLAADVKAILPSAQLTYAADWSEWFGHQPADGTGDVFFHLDPLWSDSNIAAIGIDNYWPLADWRDGNGHLDYAAGFRDPRELAYLRSNMQAGEGYDFFYASQSARNAQTRTPITDGAFGKPWVFRFKDLANWWINQHFNRPSGTESGSATSWIPQSKPFWFTEMGCPAVDRGANEPNVFFDPKSSESQLPFFSRGTRDDLMQRHYIKAIISYFDAGDPTFAATQNPVSSVYGGRMVDISRIFVYTWDARPFPQFPGAAELWADADHWQLGHWLTGRAADAPISETVSKIMSDLDFSAFDASQLTGSAQGYLLDQSGSHRDALQPLEMGFFFDAVESGGEIKFRHRARDSSIASLTVDGMVEARKGNPRYTLTRAQETDLPQVAKITYTDPNRDYQKSIAEARRLTVACTRLGQANLPIIIDYDVASRIAETWLHEAWSSRETITFALPPSQLAVECGDILTVTAGASTRDYRVTDVTIGEALTVSAKSIEAHIYDGFVPAARALAVQTAPNYGQPVAAFLDLPLITGQETPFAGRIAAYESPFPGTIAVFRSPATTGFTLNAEITQQATMGETQFAFFSGPTSRFDEGNIVRVRLYQGQLTSVSDLLLFNGANIAALETSPGVWEVLQFGNAQLVAPGVYDLSHFLRGQFGTEAAMGNPVAAGARFVLLDSAIVEVAMTAAERGLPFNWKIGPAINDIGSPSYVTVTKTFTGIGLRPYSPVHVSGARDTGGNLSIAWIRRDRLNADSWDQTEIPMSEASEAYEVDILNGGNVVRTIAVNSPAASYTAAQQVTDFGAAQSSVSIRVYQLSQTFGRGSPGIATV